MSQPTIEEILAPKPQAKPRIYAYSIHDEAHQGLLKVGQTTRDVKQRVAEQLKTADVKTVLTELRCQSAQNGHKVDRGRCNTIQVQLFLMAVRAC